MPGVEPPHRLDQRGPDQLTAPVEYFGGGRLTGRGQRHRTGASSWAAEGWGGSGEPGGAGCLGGGRGGAAVPVVPRALHPQLRVRPLHHLPGVEQPDPAEPAAQFVQVGGGVRAVPAEPGPCLDQAEGGQRLAPGLGHRAELPERLLVDLAGLLVPPGAEEDVGPHLVVVGERAGELHLPAGDLGLGEQGECAFRPAVPEGNDVSDAAQGPGPAPPVVRAARERCRLLEHGQGRVEPAGVAVDLRDPLQGPHRVARLAPGAGLGEKLLVEGGDGLVVALDAPGLGQSGERVAARHHVPALLAQLGGEPQQPEREAQRTPLARQRPPLHSAQAIAPVAPAERAAR